MTANATAKHFVNRVVSANALPEVRRTHPPFPFLGGRPIAL